MVSIDGFHELPPDSPLAFLNPDNAAAVASDPAVIAAAMNGGVSAAFDLAFPNPNDGIMAPNGTTFYRLSSPEQYGNCGPIVSIDDFAQPVNPDPVNVVLTLTNSSTSVRRFQENKPGWIVSITCDCRLPGTTQLPHRLAPDDASFVIEPKILNRTNKKARRIGPSCSIEQLLGAKGLEPLTSRM